MKTKDIVRQEAVRLIKGMVPLALIAFGALVLLGQDMVQTAFGLLAGVAYTMFLFFLIGLDAQKALLYPPDKAQRIIRRGYFLRYGMTAALIIGVLHVPFLSTAAAVLPLLFPKVILLISSIFWKKGG